MKKDSFVYDLLKDIQSNTGTCNLITVHNLITN